MTNATRTALPTLVLALFTAACGDGVLDPGTPGGGPGEPPDTVLAGVYVLTAVDGLPLPTVVFDGEVALEEGSFHLKAVAIEGVLELIPGAGYRERVRHALQVDGHPAPGGSWTDEGGYVGGASTVGFESGVIQNVRFQAKRTPGRLETSRDYVGEGRAALYRFEKGVASR